MYNHQRKDFLNYRVTHSFSHICFLLSLYLSGEEERMPAAVASSFNASEFNSWVIGGQYTKTNLKRSQMKPPKQVEDPRAAETHQAHLQQRKELLRQELEAHQLVYNPKVANALRVSSRPSRSETGGSDSPMRTSPRSNLNSREKSKQEDAAKQEQDADNSSSALRGRLQASFEQITATHAYGTLFPPLLTPFRRPCLLGTVMPTRQQAEASIPEAQSPKRPAIRNDLSVVAGERRRQQPSSGPKAFFPTGSSPSVYRHFVHIPPGERGTFAMSGAGKQHVQ